MRTTVDLPDALFKRVKAEAALRGMRLREFIAQSLEQNLAGHRDDVKSRRVRLPLIRSSGTHPINPTREQIDAMPEPGISRTALVDLNVWLSP